VLSRSAWYALLCLRFMVALLINFGVVYLVHRMGLNLVLTVLVLGLTIGLVVHWPLRRPWSYSEYRNRAWPPL